MRTFIEKRRHTREWIVIAMIYMFLITGCAQLAETAKRYPVETGAIGGLILGTGGTLLFGGDGKDAVLLGILGTGLGAGIGYGYKLNAEKEAARLEQEAAVLSQQDGVSQTAASGIDMEVETLKAQVEGQQKEIDYLKIKLAGPMVFAKGRSTLSPEVKRRLALVKKTLDDNPKTKVAIAGFTDTDGLPADNQRLSDHRAGAVEDYFLANGIAPERITKVKGYGESDPIIEDGVENKAKSRRVEIIII